MKNNKGITITSLIITIIVMVILAGIALLFSVGDSGVISRSQKTHFLNDLKLYEEELELYKSEQQIKNYGETIEIADTWDYSTIKGYIPSLKRKYDGKIGVIDNYIALRGLTDEEEKWAEEIEIKIVQDKVKVEVEVHGLGKIEGLPLDGMVKTGSNIRLTAEPQTVDGVTGEFEGWYIDDEKISTKKAEEFKIEKEQKIIAKFKTDASLIYYLDESGTEQIELNTNMSISGYSNRADIVKVEIRDGVTLAANIFNNCNNLKELIIGDNVQLTGGNTMNQVLPYNSCTSLKKITMGENIKFDIPDGRWPLFQNCKEIEEVTVKSISKVSNSTFYNIGDALKGNIIINEGETAIGGNAFYNCTSVESITLPSTITTIGANAFYNCSGIKGTLTLLEGTVLGAGAFNNCENLEILIIGDGISIPSQSFKYCSSLEKIIIGNNVSIVGGSDVDNGGGTFGRCEKLKTVEMGENIVITGGVWSNYLFKGSPSLEKVTVKSLSSAVPNYALTGAGKALQGSVIINEGITSIGANAFSNCSNLTSITLPSTITKVDSNAFNNCSGMTEEIIFPENLKTFGQNAFYNCSGIKGTLTLLEGTVLGAGAFNNCENLEMLIIGDGISIPSQSFKYCSSLEKIIIGNNVSIVGGTDSDSGGGTFGRCEKLKTVEMGENIVITGGVWSNYMFNGSPSLEKVTVKSLSSTVPNYALTGAGAALKGKIIINEGVETIGAYAFNGCSNLEVIDVDMTEEAWNSITKGTNWNSGVKATMNFLK